MKLIFTNAYGNKGEIEQKEIDIKGKCTITNYDTRTETPDDKGDLTVKVDGKNSSIMVGTEEQQDSQTVNMNAKKYSIFTALAGMDGDGSNLSQKDIEKAKNNFNDQNSDWQTLAELGVTSIRYDSHKGIATIVIGDNEILRIDFETRIEKVKNFLGIDSKKEVQGEKPVEDENINTETDTADKIEYMPYDQFVDAIMMQESRGRANVQNRAGYVGLFQIGEQALADLGIYKKKSKNYNNDWKGTFVKNKYGITSIQDFKNYPDKQKKVFADLLRKHWEYISVQDQDLRLDKYVGQEINGQIITEAGLLAGAHLVGVQGLRKYLESGGKQDVKDGNGVSVSHYISKFANYDLSNITGVAPGTVPPEIVYENVEYNVVAGDNLYNIAKKFNTSIDRIRTASGLTNDSLQIGDKLIVPQGKYKDALDTGKTC